MLNVRHDPATLFYSGVRSSHADAAPLCGRVYCCPPRPPRPPLSPSSPPTERALESHIRGPSPLFLYKADYITVGGNRHRASVFFRPANVTITTVRDSQGRVRENGACPHPPDPCPPGAPCTNVPCDLPLLSLFSVPPA